MTNKNEFGFSKNIKTNICQEIPTDNNSYVANERLISGYNIEELSANCSFLDTTYLLFKGELPNNIDSKLLNTLFITLINLGPRHPAIRSSMTAGISKANSEHLLPIGLLSLGGEKGGAKEVEKSYVFLKNNITKDPIEVAHNLLKNHSDPHQHLVPGFGSHYGNIDPILSRALNQLTTIKPKSAVLKWCYNFTNEIKNHNIGLLPSGIAAAVFLELNTGKREAVTLFQLACAPGLAAHGIEQTHRPITDMPLLEDEKYVLKQ